MGCSRRIQSAIQEVKDGLPLIGLGLIALIVVGFVTWFIYSWYESVEASNQQQQKEDQITLASQYDVSGTIQQIRKIDDRNQLLQSTMYYVRIAGKNYAVGHELSTDFQIGKWVHITGDRYGIDRLETTIP